MVFAQVVEKRFSSGGISAGYIPGPRSAAYGGYGADVSTRFEMGAGE
jgi:hypothetical protein